MKIKIILVFMVLLFSASCSKRHASDSGNDLPESKALLNEMSLIGSACYKVYYENDAVRAKKVFLKYLQYLDAIDTDINNSDSVFSRKALALARLAYINRYLAGIEVDWSESVAVLKKTGYAKKWTDAQAQYYMKSIIADNDKGVSWINEKEIRQSIPENWLEGPRKEPQSENDYYRQKLIDRIVSGTGEN